MSGPSATIWYLDRLVVVPPSRLSLTFPSLISASCAPTVTVPLGMAPPHSSTTVIATDAIFGFLRSIVFGFAVPSLFTFTGAVITVLPDVTVSVPLFDTGTCLKDAFPLSSVFLSCRSPLSSTIVTVAFFTGLPPFTTVIVTSLTGVSLIVIGFAMPLSSTDTITSPPS